ncbi:MAG: ATP-binding protein, partial [Desulforhabdus sp.]|nr:ATP-binding protein [Desulforhabdus sp.]
RVVEIVLFNTIAIIIGILKDRERERYHQLVMAESLAAMGRAVSAAAHDMKTPLIAIGGFTNLVISKLRKIDQGTGEAPEIITDVQEKLAIVIKETERLENMVKEMLDFARPLPLQKSKENLRQIIEESAAIVEASASTKQIRIVNQTGEDLPPASIDPDRFKQVLVNLLMNAIQASPPGEQVTITGFAKAANLAIDVTDCGCGIPLDKRAEIFDPFFTTKKEGTGLGLPIAKKIIDAHGGKLEIVDNQHTGLSFRITIPL